MSEIDWNQYDADIDLPIYDLAARLATERDALNATITALRNGEEPPHYCAYCMTEVDRTGSADHMLVCEQAPYGKLTQQLVDAVGHVRLIAKDIYADGAGDWCPWCNQDTGHQDDCPFEAARAWLKEIDP